MCTSTEMNKFTIYSRMCSSWEKLKHREQVINGQKADEGKGRKRRREGQITKELITILRVSDFILVALGDQ